jgi:hypothetical protein
VSVSESAASKLTRFNTGTAEISIKETRTNRLVGAACLDPAVHAKPVFSEFTLLPKIASSIASVFSG